MIRGRLDILCIVLVVSSFYLSIYGQVKVGAGSYTTTAPGALPPAKPHVTQDFSQKVLSNKWWVNFMTQQGFTVAYAHPLSFDARSGGLDIGYMNKSRWNQTHKTDLSVTMAGLGGALVARYSHWSVTMRWEGGGNRMEALMGQGFPFAYLTVQGGSVSVSGGAVWYNQNGVIGVTAGGNYYAVFGPSGCTWTTGATLTSSLAGKGYLSIALLPDSTVATLEFFKKYAYSFVTETRVTWDYLESTAQLVSHFAVTTDVKEGSENGTVFALFRHQWPDVITPLTNYSYESVRGQMKVAIGKEFITSMRFNGILPALPFVGHDAAKLNGYINSQDIETTSGDTYGAGYRMGHYGHVAAIADLAGNTARRDAFIAALKKSLEEWFTVGGPQQFYYDKTWNRMIGYPASFGSNDRLSDHHFHYGYFIQASAIIARWDTVWAQKQNWGGMVDMLVRDVNSWDDNDTLFGRFQNFDPYEGHGWADGMGFAAGNNQESSSESMNCNSGFINWGINTGDKTIRDMGIFMYVNETRAVEQYWYNVDKEVFPQDFNHTMAGMVWSNGGAYGTWFSGDRGCIHGINFLPVTGGSLYMGRRPDYVPLNYAEGFTGTWADVFYEFLAFADGPRALSLFSGLSSAVAAGSMALVYYNIASCNAAGHLCTSVAGNVPSYAVFDKETVRTYTAYNPDFKPTTVTFTDGFSMEVPARSQITRIGKVVPVVNAMKQKIPRSIVMNRIINVQDRFSLPLLDEKVTAIEVVDISGKKVLESSVRNGRAVRFEAGRPVAKGIYFIKAYE
jgi:endoglucanase Acf2